MKPYSWMIVIVLSALVIAGMITRLNSLRREPVTPQHEFKADVERAIGPSSTIAPQGTHEEPDPVLKVRTRAHTRYAFPDAPSAWAEAQPAKPYMWVDTAAPGELTWDKNYNNLTFSENWPLENKICVPEGCLSIGDIRKQLLRDKTDRASSGVTR